MKYSSILMACAAVGLMLTSISPILAQSSPDAETQAAMRDAIEDEYQARAIYQAAIAKFGNVRPFSNIVRAEGQHVALWETLFARYGMSVPPDTYAGKVTIPDTLYATCEAGVAAEIANVEMYENFLTFVREPDLRAAFTRLQQISQERHLPAFQRCVNRGG
jgi:hypothetical protein